MAAGFRSLFAFWIGGYGKQQEVVEPPVPQPLPEQVIPSGGIAGPFQPRGPLYRIVGKGDGLLPPFIAVAEGFVPRIEGRAVATLRGLFMAEAQGTIPNFGEASAQIGFIKGGASGTVKFLHDDEEMLILMLAA